MATFTERVALPAQTTVQIFAGNGASWPSLANNALLLSASVNNLANTAGFDGAPNAYLTVAYKCGAAPAAGNVFQVWILGAKDLGQNLNYEDGGVAVTPDRIPDVQFPVSTGATNTYHQCQLPVQLKAGWQQFLFKNSSGVALSSESNAQLGLFLSAEQRTAS